MAVIESIIENLTLWPNGVFGAVILALNTTSSVVDQFVQTLCQEMKYDGAAEGLAPGWRFADFPLIIVHWAVGL